MALLWRIIGNCPGCGGVNCYGNQSIDDNIVQRRCKQCKWKSQVWLPDINKKIIYLDQFALSGAFKGGDERFVRVVERVKRVCRLQLAQVPYSSVHEDETSLWTGYDGRTSDDLMAFIKSTAGGSEFQPVYTVEQTQLVKGFMAHLDSRPAEYLIEQDDAVEGDTSQWDTYFYIDVGKYQKDVAAEKKAKEAAVQQLVNAFDEWSASTNTFDTDVLIEIRSAGRSYIDAYVQMVMRFAEAGDLMELANPPMTAHMIQVLMTCVPDNMEPNLKIAAIQKYFASPHFASLPFVQLSSMMWAALKREVKLGAHVNREKALQRLAGVFYDVSHISTYAPYCDAIFVDQPMAQMICTPPMQINKNFKAKVFSLKNVDEFLDWLDTLEAGMTDEHRAGVLAAYGDI